MIRGGMDGMFLPCISDKASVRKLANAEAKQSALAIFDKIPRSCKGQSAQTAGLAVTSKDAYRLPEGRQTGGF